MSLTIALAGNPNSGKTTMFNKLTGANQRVGNWPGVTIDRKVGKIRGTDYELVDLPGIYSLSPYSPEEIVSRNFLINDNPTLNKLSTLLKNNELSRLSISKLKIDFAIANGDITVKPFTVDLANIPTTIQGTQSVNGELNYTLSMNVDKKYFGNDINNVLKTISGSDNIKALDVDVKIGGTLDKPTVTPDLSKALKTIQKEAGKNLKDNLLKGLNKLFK